MASWPSSLPNFGAGMQEARQEGFIRTPMSAGPSKQRRRFSAASRYLSGSVVFTAAQRATFDTFYQITINEGADEFTFEDPVDFSEVTARFMEAPIYTALAGAASGVPYWRVSLKLEILP